jgi:phosphatidylglycerophosphatase A
MKDLPPFPANHPATWIASWGGCGFLRPGPGTWGTIGALPVALPIALYGGKAAFAVFIVAVTLLGLWAIRVLQARLGIQDDGRIVVDEVAGMSLALLLIPLTPLAVLCAFVLFRLLDIAKPFPIGWLDRHGHGAWGVMADDLLAGLFAGQLTFGLIHLLHGI